MLHFTEFSFAFALLFLLVASLMRKVRKYRLAVNFCCRLQCVCFVVVVIVIACLSCFCYAAL